MTGPETGPDGGHETGRDSDPDDDQASDHRNDDLDRIHVAARLDDAIAYRLHRTNRLLLTHLGRMLSDHHDALTPELWFVLARIDVDGPLRPVDLTEPALVDAPNVSRLVERLVRARLVERSPDPVDRRSHLLSTTSDGAHLADEIRTRVIGERRRVFAGFAASELDALGTALARLDDNLRPLLTGERTDLAVR